MGLMRRSMIGSPGGVPLRSEVTTRTAGPVSHQFPRKHGVSEPVGAPLTMSASGVAGLGSAAVTGDEAVDAVALNRANWDDRAAIHGQDGYYDTEGLVAGAESLTDVEAAAVAEALADRAGSVAGLDVLHVQCHIGFDSVSLARRGARVTGVDLSPASLAKARAIAARCGVEVSFVEGNSMALPAGLHGRFDLAYATIGVLCWIGDVEAWMRSVAACLRTGGKLVLVDGHPLAGMVDGLDDGRLRLAASYGDIGPQVIEVPGSYTDRTAVLANPTTVQFSHSLGEIVTAAAGAGLRVVALHEHLDAPLDLTGHATADANGRYRLTVDGQDLPMLYTLLASR